MKTLAVTSKTDWESFWEEFPLKYDQGLVGYTELYDKFLKPGGSCFEVGCYPGNTLLYLVKELGFKLSGIDFLPMVKTRMPTYLAEHNVIAEELVCGDFQSFKTTKTYDVVISNGFIEHFINFEEIIIKQIQLVKPGGTLFMRCPNFTGLQYYLRYFLDNKQLQGHVIQAMNLRKWRRILEANDMEILYHQYYRTAGFWISEQPKIRWKRIAARKIKRMCERIDARITFPNKLLSPFLVSISRRNK